MSLNPWSYSTDHLLVCDEQRGTLQVFRVLDPFAFIVGAERVRCRTVGELLGFLSDHRANPME